MENQDKTIRSYIDVAVRDRADAPAQKFFSGGEIVTRTYREFQSRIVRVSAMLHSLGLVPGRDNVALMLENCPEWEEIYLGLSSVGFTVVPMDPKLKEAEVRHILSDSESAAIFCGQKHVDMIEDLAGSLPNLRVRIVDCAGGEAPKAGFLSYHALFDATADDAAARSWFDENAPSPKTVASLIYTSGTTGSPKGAMLTHGNITSNVDAAVEVDAFKNDDVFLVALPLFHAFSFAFSFMLAIATGGCGCFIRSLKTISDDIRIFSPTTILAVPLMAEKMYAKIEEKLSASKAVALLRAVGLSCVVSRAVRKALGGKVRRMAIGGAPTSHKVLEGFARYGVPAKEGYGLTECSPLVSWPGIFTREYRIGTVGPVLRCMEYKIVDKDETGAGELCVRGPNVTIGYYKNDEATKRAFDSEGYFMTGDIVREDDERNITICGRRKALIVNREGKNIYPEEIENVVGRCPYVSECVSVGYTINGETGEHVGLIVIPNEDRCREAGVGDEAVLDAIKKLCNDQLAEYKVPRKIQLRREPFELTSTMKVKRVTYQGTLDE